MSLNKCFNIKDISYMNQNQNRFLNKFQSHMNTQVNPFANNPMINSNPNFSNNDNGFYTRMQMQKLDKIKNAKSINEMGIDKKQLFEQVINPIMINKTSKNELSQDHHKIVQLYPTISTSNPKSNTNQNNQNNQNQNNQNQNNQNQPNAYLNELWTKRTNQPYKTVIKKDLFEKNYKKYYNDKIFNTNINNKAELIVHKVTNIDADKVALESELSLLESVLDSHNTELKSTYTETQQTQYKKEFEYTQKYRYRLQYNPANSEELKDYYKKEQKKINSSNKIFDELIAKLVDKDELTDEQILLLNNELELAKKEKNNLNIVENDLRKELGDEYDSIINAIQVEDSTTMSEIKPLQKKIKSTTLVNSNVIQADVSQDIKNKYKNR
jgi:hypothetical protein